MSETTPTQDKEEYRPKLTLDAAKQLVFTWLDAMKYRRTNWQEHIIFEEKEKGFFKLVLWTNEFKYTITVSIDKDYISCYAQHRKIRPGDKEPKHNDLHSGKIKKETFDHIIYDIVSYELISIFKKKSDTAEV